ncbi:hypothetical protein GGR57DRAFT_508537 [Xylariaceae sp. FL1272]|nr:hypothetical protein GGR57DRAFT_508537 [Xylariaceae sp. FL1272]
MDPISALNIAAAVVQFIDFTTQLLKDYGEIRQSGQPLTYEAFEQTTNDLLKLNATLKDRKRVHGGRGGLKEHEEALDAIMEECGRIATRLVAALHSLRPKKVDRAEIEAMAMAGKKIEVGKWRTFLQALQTIWKADEIASLRSRLSILQEQLTLRVLACVSAKVDHYATDNARHFDDLQKKGSKVVEIVSFNQGELKRFRDDFDQSMKDVKKHHGDVIAAIMTLSTGETRALTPRGQQANPATLVSGRFEQSVLRLTDSVSEAQVSSSLDEFSFSFLHQSILSWMYFRQITDREDNVNDAHRQTFRWIFQHSVGHQRPWSDFPRWLREGSGCYWINGKAGSGKSTLMKYIWQEERTWHLLQSWFGTSRSISASFYFWNLGSKLQKTQGGLLRSLLHDVLSKHPDLVPVIMPEHCRDAMRSRDFEGDAPSLSELKKYFRRLLDQASPRCRMFFLIDGIDEYDGDYTDLIHLIQLSSSSHVKLLISSRPITACIEASSSLPGLRLHDLTREDMHNYASDLLQKALKKRGDNWLQLIKDLVDKSSGVFLWLALVVRSLLHGLRDGDSLEELELRLEELPSDLADLYAHMLNKIPGRYRAQASDFFQTFLKSQSVELDIRRHPLLAIQLSFVEERWAQVQSAPTQALNKKGERQRCEQMESRIRSRCCGLLEFQERKNQRRLGEPREHFSRPHLEFIHKTAAEFLRDEEIWNRIKSWSGANPYLGLIQSCIMVIKSTKPADVVYTRYSVVWDSMYTALRYAHLAEAEGGSIPDAYLELLDSSLMSHWNVAGQYIRPYLAEHIKGGIDRLAVKPQAHWSTILFWDQMVQGKKWIEETKNCDNHFSSLVSIHDESTLLTGSEDIGFFRVIVVYSLRSYIKGHLLTAESVSTTDQSILQFWLGLLTSTFPLRLRMPASYQFSLSLLQTVAESTCVIDEELIMTIWKIFLIELCSSRNVRDVTNEEAGRITDLVTAMFEKVDSGSKSLYTQAAQALTPRLVLMSSRSHLTATALREVASWLGIQMENADEKDSIAANDPNVSLSATKIPPSTDTSQDNEEQKGGVHSPDRYSFRKVFRQIKFRSPFAKWEAEKLERWNGTRHWYV